MKHLPVLLIVVLLLSACSGKRELMPTPSSLAASEVREVGADTPEALRSTGLELLYFTNRAPSVEENGGYGEERSRSLAFGTGTVFLGEDLSWELLAEASEVAERDEEVFITLGPVQELGRYPPEPYGLIRTEDGYQRSPESMAQHQEARKGAHTMLADAATRTGSGTVLLYVHGFNESIESSAATLAELCHFLERKALCTLFTWPASQGTFLSYTETTETADFAVGHLRKVLRVLASSPDVERINLLAHSRGSPLLLSALREVMITTLAFGADPIETLKIHHVVLAAPDIDVDIAMRKFELFLSEPDTPVRWEDDRFPDIISGRFTTYLSPNDRALSISAWLFGGANRVGVLNPLLGTDPIQPQDISLLTELGMVDVMVVSGKRSSVSGHSYFTRDPEVSADLIALFGEDALPGDPERPATAVSPSVWQLSEDE
ncbi:MAG: alpha/beta hydrolase [Pseudomonadota bacterium]